MHIVIGWRDTIYLVDGGTYIHLQNRALVSCHTYLELID